MSLKSSNTIEGKTYRLLEENYKLKRELAIAYGAVATLGGALVAIGVAVIFI